MAGPLPGHFDFSSRRLRRPPLNPAPAGIRSKGTAFLDFRLPGMRGNLSPKELLRRTGL
jgi:hypothetical protein